MSGFKKEHIIILRRYFLSENASIKNEILESFSAELREKVLLIQNEFENSTDSKSIALQINALEFEKELEEIQSAYYLNKLGLSNQEFEKELIGAIKTIKKKLIAFDEIGREDVMNVELKSAITLIERESLKKKLQSLEDSSEGKVIGLRPTPASGTIPLNSILNYAVAACVVLAIGIGVYQFTRQDVIPENTMAYSSEEKPIDQLSEDVQEIETLPLAEVSIESNFLVVLKSGLGFGESEEKITVVENNQQLRILSIKRGISEYQRQLDDATKSDNQDTVQFKRELQSRIASLQEELLLLNARENRYRFDGKKLTLFISTTQTENKIIDYDANYYLEKDSKFFRLSISKEPQPFQEEIDPNVLKALDKIIFNAE